MTDAQRAKRDADLAALTPEDKPEPKKERGHARGTTDDRRIQDKSLRGVPLVGAGPGVIDGTRPGDTVARLEQANRDLHNALMRRARLNLKHKETT